MSRAEPTQRQVASSGLQPPRLWRGRYSSHDQLLVLCERDEHAAIYLDHDVERWRAFWLLSFVSDAWQYTKHSYGAGFGPDPRLYAVCRGRALRGRSGVYPDPAHGIRTIVDVGLRSWSHPVAFDCLSRELAQVVESVNSGGYDSPCRNIWRGDVGSLFYRYDLYRGLGMNQDAGRLRAAFDRTISGFPRPGTAWFRDWFHPLWRAAGGPDVMARFFRLLADRFPRNGQRYARELNWGEYLHFTGAAAQGDVTDLARRAFGWRPEWDAELERAKAEFPVASEQPPAA